MVQRRGEGNLENDGEGSKGGDQKPVNSGTLFTTSDLPSGNETAQIQHERQKRFVYKKEKRKK